MAEVAAPSFADLLKQYRAAAGLTQEELAERANLSARAVSDLERGIKQRPYPHTVQRLVQALELEERQADRFRRAVRRQEGAADERGESIRPVSQSLSLPLQPTTFIGREQEVEEVGGMLHREGVRLLTLTGPGGVGKTRLALRAAEQMQDAFTDGVVFVSLASLADPGLVPSAIATGLGVREVSGQSMLESLAQYLWDKRLLLVLDNYEHLLEAAEVVSRLLARCPRLTILVTSRATLHLAAEHEYPIPPLPVPPPRHLPELDALSRYDAIQLFVQRAQAVEPHFGMTERNAAAIAEICHHLDGLPLAIELAAARIRLFPPQALLRRLSSRLALLTAGPRDQPARQQTLRNTIDWSYHLLTADEQALFARLSVFAGGCTFGAAEAVCAPDGAFDLLRVMTSLVEQSLVRQQGEREPQLTMLETVREYAAEKLDERGEGESIRAAHTEYILRLAEEAERELHGPNQAGWFSRLAADLDNVRAALDQYLAREEAEKELRVAAALRQLWFFCGYRNEFQHWLEEGLAAGGGVAPGVRAKAHFCLGTLAYSQGDYDRATQLLDGALDLYHEIGDRTGSARVLMGRGMVAWRRGQYDRATALHEESLRLSTALEDHWTSAGALNNLGRVAWHQGEWSVANERFEKALAICRALGDTVGSAEILENLGMVALEQGNLNEAKDRVDEALASIQKLGKGGRSPGELGHLGAILREAGTLEEAELMLEESLGRARELGARFWVAYALGVLGEIAREQGKPQAARERVRESLSLARELEQPHLTLGLLGKTAVLAVEAGEVQRASRLKGAEAALRARLGIPLSPLDRAESEESMTKARAMLGGEAFACSWEGGQAMSLQEAITYALE